MLSLDASVGSALPLSIVVGSSLMMLVVLGSSILGRRWSCLLRYLEIRDDLPRRLNDGVVTKKRLGFDRNVLDQM